MTRPALRTLLMVGLPALFLLVFFVAPNAVLLTTSLLKSESQVITDQVTLENFTYLLASVIVRTYGWWVPLNTDGAVNDTLRAMGFAPLTMLPSTGAIIGLVHSLLPYGVLTILSATNGINPNLEKAAMSLGGSRWRTFVTVTLPLSMPGIAGGFLLAFSLSISPYATPAILGGPATSTMATQIYDFLTALDEWSLGSAMSAIRSA